MPLRPRNRSPTAEPQKKGDMRLVQRESEPRNEEAGSKQRIKCRVLYSTPYRVPQRPPNAVTTWEPITMSNMRYAPRMRACAGLGS